MKARISFAPLKPDAVDCLVDGTGIDFLQVDFTLPAWLCMTARSPGGSIMGVLVAEFEVWFEAHITCVVLDPAFVTRKLLRAVCTALFSRAVRITGMCRPENDRSIRILRHLGFQYEGRKRLAIEGKWDALVFGMTRDECRWIRAPEFRFAKAA